MSDQTPPPHPDEPHAHADPAGSGSARPGIEDQFRQLLTDLRRVGDDVRGIIDSLKREAPAGDDAGSSADAPGAGRQFFDEGYRKASDAARDLPIKSLLISAAAGIALAALLRRKH